MRIENENKIIAVLFALLWILSACGIYKYLCWLFSMPLATTAAIVGIILVIPIMIGEILYTIFTAVLIGGILE